MDPKLILEFVTALGIGLLIGLERERNPTAKAGLRTFSLLALAGAVTQLLANQAGATWLVAAGLLAVAAMMITAYYHHHEPDHDRDPGTTTIAAAVVCFLLGAMTTAGYGALATALAIAVAGLLYFKVELSTAVKGLDRAEVIAILQFAVIAFVVLPLLPDQNLGPYGAWNPRHIWHMVVLVSGVSLAGFIALRLVDSRHGPRLAGALGGLVSSTATTLSFSRLAHESPNTVPAAAAAIVTANLVLPLRVMAIVAVVAPALAGDLAVPVVLAVSSGALLHLAAKNSSPTALTAPKVDNPAGLRTALTFALLYAGILVLVAWAADVVGQRWVLAVAAISGLTDVDALTLSTSRLHEAGGISSKLAIAAIVTGIVANGLFKLGIIARVGGRALLKSCALPLSGMLIAALGGMVWLSFAR